MRTGEALRKNRPQEETCRRWKVRRPVSRTAFSSNRRSPAGASQAIFGGRGRCVTKIQDRLAQQPEGSLGDRYVTNPRDGVSGERTTAVDYIARCGSFPSGESRNERAAGLRVNFTAGDIGGWNARSRAFWEPSNAEHAHDVAG